MKISDLPAKILRQFVRVIKRNLVIAPANAPRPPLPEKFTVEPITEKHVEEALRSGRLEPVKAERFVHGFLRAGGNRGAVILDPEGIPAAWCFMSPRKVPKPFWLKHDTYTVPEFRCRGLGFYLNTLMVNEFSNGLPVVCTVRKNNRPAMRNWEKMNATVAAEQTTVRFLRGLWQIQRCRMLSDDEFANSVAIALKFKK